MNKTTKRIALGTIFAAVAGYVTGILTAPKSGKETRKDIKHAAEQGIAEAEKQLKKLHGQMSDLLDEAKDKVKGLRGSAQKDLQAAIDKVALSKEQAHDMLSDVRAGGAQDKELKKAIKDAGDAVQHLRNFLSR